MSFSAEEIQEFKTEAFELLDVAETSLLALDDGGNFRTAFDAVFRGFHNLKGAAGMMELTKLQSHTHELENILMTFKSREMIPRPYVSMFLRGIDAARSLLNDQDISFDFKVEGVALPPVEAPAVVAIESPGPAFESDKTALAEFINETDEGIERISRHLQTMETGTCSKDMIDEIYRDIHSLKGSSYLLGFQNLGNVAHAMESGLEGVRSGTHEMSAPLLNVLFKTLALIEKLLLKARGGSDHDEYQPEIVLLTAEFAKSVDQSIKKFTDSSITTTSALAQRPIDDKSESGSSIRVPVALLDNLMALMGEMVLVRNQVLQFSNRSEDLEFLSMSKRLNVVTSEIQGQMMKTRMQPIGTVLTKFTRVVRDLSQELGKKINLSITGAETELDKSLLEAIKDPLTHIVRNSCDHGIEMPEARRKTGKSETGNISIHAYHEGGQVVIEIQDDGKGLDREAMIAKAIEKGIVTPADAARLTSKQTFALIFAPGFSTAAKVTNVSGRGVGMDVVRTNIERMGGTVDLSSTTGSGITTKLKIPLTLAIVPALTVRCGTGTFAIPQVKLEELVRVDQSGTSLKIEFLHGAPVLRLRGNILPLVDLNEILRLRTEKTALDGITNIAVVNAEQTSFGLIIDEVFDTADIVVKPLNRLLKSLQVFSGATILGNGAVALILDVLGISKVAQLATEKSGSATNIQESGRNASEIQDYLLVDIGQPTKHAIVLGYVHRLEECRRSSIEVSGAQRVLRYGQVILPLISANKLLGYSELDSNSETVSIVVIRRSGKLYGLEVRRIIDTLSTDVDMTPAERNQPGMFGNLNMPDELIVVIDPFDVINDTFPTPVPSLRDTIRGATASTPLVSVPEAEIPTSNRNPTILNARSANPEPIGPRRILIAEDTVFFRRALRKVLEASGYEVVTVNDGMEAIDLLTDSATPFDLIISDIEMPRLSGFELATKIRSTPRFAHLPLLAVSSRAEEDFMKEGLRVGFNGYLEKLRPEILLNAVAELIGKSKGAA